MSDSIFAVTRACTCCHTIKADVRLWLRTDGEIGLCGDCRLLLLSEVILPSTRRVFRRLLRRAFLRVNEMRGRLDS